MKQERWLYICVILLLVVILLFRGIFGGGESLPDLDSILFHRGYANAVIQESTAKHMKHAFDQYFRNPTKYSPGGTCNRCSPDVNDGDLPCEDGGNDTLTRAVWVDKSVIAYLTELLVFKHCDGARIYIAAYDVSNQAPGQEGCRQSTVYIVPTKRFIRGGDTLHIDDFKVVKEVREEYLKQKQAHNPNFTVGDLEAAEGNVLNHGELCPTDCDTSQSSGAIPKKIN